MTFDEAIREEQGIARNDGEKHRWVLRIRIVGWKGRNPVQEIARSLGSFFGWLREKRRTQISSRRLRVCETLSLGEKRFIALVQVDGKNFLVGGAPTNVSLLAQLEGSQPFSESLKRQFRSEMAGD